jgi:predicted DNA-binding protein (UPF0251 family)
MSPRALEAEILRLHNAEHWPVGTIAKQLRVHHSTVRRVLAQAGPSNVRHILSCTEQFPRNRYVRYDR